SFDRSRQDRRTSKERSARRRSGLAGDQAPVTTIAEQTVREQNGDPRFLTIATRIAERQDRLWVRGRNASPGGASSGWPRSTNSCSGIRLSSSRAGRAIVYNNVGSVGQASLRALAR
ncbi:MAG TPA: hypothetical protein VNH11_14520, partial [Pirellulales bacterium]|nr:hypothetical protein [Pirellulales bacterium]